MKKTILFLITLATGFLLASPALAALKLTLSPIPEYQDSANFRLYYAYLDTEDNEATINLYVQKEGDSWRQTRDKNKTEVSGYFQIEDADIYDGEGKYSFYAQGKTASVTENSQTVSVVIDRSNPDKVTNFKKERVGETAYRLSWTNPDNDDFYQVYLYRSQDKSFTANSSTKIGEAGGSANEKMTFEDSGLEKDTTYYYALRVIDQAGNASGLVTDAPGEVIAGEVAGVTTEEGTGGIEDTDETEVILLTEEERQTREEIADTIEEDEKEAEEEGTLLDEGQAAEKEGQVMGEEDNQSLTKKLWLIIPLGLLFLAAAFFFFGKKA